MTLFQETTSAPKRLNSDATLSAPMNAIFPFQAMLAGLVIVLTAVAVASSLIAGRPTTTAIQGAPSYVDPYREFIQAPAVGAPSYVDPYREFVQAPTILLRGGSFAPGYPLHGGLAGPSRVGINAAGSFAPGYPRHGGLAGPSRIEINAGDARVIDVLLWDDLAAAGGSSLRSAPQAADGASDGDNQRFVQAD
jgi:hypothetical protein